LTFPKVELILPNDGWRGLSRQQRGREQAQLKSSFHHLIMGSSIYQTFLANRELVNAVKSQERRFNEYFRERGLSLESINETKFVQDSPLKGLYLAKCKGNKSWQGLVVGFPGTKKQLATANVSTPYM